MVRAVKPVPGKGLTVQLSQKQFGFIELCELTDEIVGNVIGSKLSEQPLFLARVIDVSAKNDKPMLSARESVVDEKTWTAIQEGKSVHF